MQVVYLSGDWCAKHARELRHQLAQFLQQHAWQQQVQVTGWRLLLTADQQAPQQEAAAAAAEKDSWQLVPSVEFHDKCKKWQVQSLPAVVLVDPQSDTNLLAAEVSEWSPSPDAVITAIQGFLRQQQTALDLHKGDAAKHIEQAVLLPPNHPTLVASREEAARVFEAGEMVPAACGFYHVLRQSEPTCPISCYNLAVILHTLGETKFAIPLLVEVLRNDPDDGTTLSFLRNVCLPLEPEASCRALSQLAEWHPKNLKLQHVLASLQGTSETAQPQYVRQVFDELSATFETKLLLLEYKVPWQLVDLIKRHKMLQQEPNAKPTWRVMDLGCGTGLCGRLLRPFVAHLIGVDISPLMIEQTRKHDVYDVLYAQELLSVLQQEPKESLHLVIAADVWIYVGALEDIFRETARVLHPTGLYAFSIELLAESQSPPSSEASENSGSNSVVDFKLALSGRFQHKHAYIERLAVTFGFSICGVDDIVVRKESGEPIPGKTYLLQRQVSVSSSTSPSK